MSELRALRRNDILQAACLEFSKKGFAAARMEEIARSAGIGKSTVYEYFPSKLELLENTAVWMLDRITSDITCIMHGALPFADKVKEYLIYLCQYSTQVGYGMIYMLGGKQQAVDIMKRCTIKFFDSVLSIITEAVAVGIETGELRNDANPNVIAQIVYCLPSPIMTEQVSRKDFSTIEQMIALIMQGISAKPQ